MTNQFSVKRISTTTRLMVIYAVVSAAALGLVLTQVVRTYASHAKSVIMSDLGEEVPQFAQAANLRAPGESLYSFSKSYLATHALANQHILYIHIFGHSTLGSAGSSKDIAIPDVTQFLASPPGSTKINTVNYKSASYLVLGSPVTVSKKVVGSLVAVTSLSGLSSQESQVLLLAGAEALLSLIFSVAAGYFLMRRIMRAVGRVTETAVEISKGDLDRRLDFPSQSDEVGKLALAFDGMIGRISQTLDSQRRLLADVSHQLKTPLTVIRGNLELLHRSSEVDKAELNDVIEVVTSEIDYMKTMLDGLLLLERMSEPEPLNEEEVELRPFLTDIFSSAISLGRRNWRLGDIPDIVVRIDGQKCRGAILNLLDNAVKATSNMDRISLDAYDSDGYLAIVVSDSGSGIEPTYLAKIFERFERGAARDQRGAGLGLAIVRAVSHAHGGDIDVESVYGEGSSFTFRIPSNRIVRKSEVGIEYRNS